MPGTGWAEFCPRVTGDSAYTQGTVDIWYFTFELRDAGWKLWRNAVVLQQFRMIAQSSKQTWTVSCMSVRGYVHERTQRTIHSLYQIHFMHRDIMNLVEQRRRAIGTRERIDFLRPFPALSS